MACNLLIAAACLVAAVFAQPASAMQSSRSIAGSVWAHVDLPYLRSYAMAQRPKGLTTARTATKNAGKPKTSSTTRAAGRAPTDEDLDLRDRLKSGPRRQGGPPLSGDHPDRESMRALRQEVIPEPTDPKEP
jgi:hypothetical protein